MTQLLDTATLAAKKVPFSTITGQSVTLHNAQGHVVAQLSIRGVTERLEMTRLADWLVFLINTENGTGR